MWTGNIEPVGSVLGRQANLKESSKSKELAEMRLQVLAVVITSDACESKKEIMRLKSDLQSEVLNLWLTLKLMNRLITNYGTFYSSSG